MTQSESRRAEQQKMTAKPWEAVEVLDAPYGCHEPSCAAERTRSPEELIYWGGHSPNSSPGWYCANDLEEARFDLMLYLRDARSADKLVDELVGPTLAEELKRRAGESR